MQAPSQPELEALIAPVVSRAPFATIVQIWQELIGAYGRTAERALAKVDRFYLLCVVLHRPDAINAWLYARCREVEAETDDCLDLWAREHYKSTIITFAGAIQEIIKDPEITIGIFSHTKPVAKKFQTQIKAELETNQTLKDLFPEVFWQEPKRQSPRWSEDKGLVVRRTTNPKEATVEAHGLVDGQPTGAHFRLRIYDDVVTIESVTTPEMVKKTTEAHGLSDNLGARDPQTGRKRRWHLGTRYKYSDTYQDLIDRKSLKLRLYAATEDGTPTGKPVFLTQEQLDQLRRDQVSSIFAAQQLMNPSAGTEAMFQPQWPRFTDIRPATLNVYVMCDPASSRKKGSDRTAILVVGIDAARNKYLLDGVAHKMGLQERWRWLKAFQKHWSTQPGVQICRVGYERYGLLDAMEHFEERMEVEKCGFEIVELSWPREGGNAKYDRIQRLEPDYRGGKWFLAMQPTRTDIVNGVEVQTAIDETTRQQEMRNAGQAFRVMKPVRRMDGEKEMYSLNKLLLDEYVAYPYSKHDDLLDCQSRLYDMDPAPPVIIEGQILDPQTFVDGA